MERTNYWSGMKPSVEDLTFDQDAKESAIKVRFTDTFIQGVVPGVGDELQVTVPDPTVAEVQIGTGEAYIQGEKVKVTTPQTVTLDAVDQEDNIIWIRYTQQQSDFRPHYITGDQYPCRLLDSFEVGATRESLFDPTGKMVLARASKNNLGVYVTDLREFLRLKPELLHKRFKDDTPPPAPTSVQVETGVEEAVAGPQQLTLPQTAWVKASWTPVEDQESGLATYEVVWIPLDPDEAELLEQRIEATVTYNSSPIRTDYTFRGIPIGQRGVVKVRAVDATGNRSAYAQSTPITAGEDPSPIAAPEISLTSTPYGAKLSITPVDGADGYEIYLGYGSPPAVHRDRLFYQGPATVHRFHADPGETVFVRVRAFTKSGTYSEFSDAQVEIEGAATPYGFGGTQVPGILSIYVNESGISSETVVYWLSLSNYGLAVRVKRVSVIRLGGDNQVEFDFYQDDKSKLTLQVDADTLTRSTDFRWILPGGTGKISLDPGGLGTVSFKGIVTVEYVFE